MAEQVPGKESAHVLRLGRRCLAAHQLRAIDLLLQVFGSLRVLGKKQMYL